MADLHMGGFLCVRFWAFLKPFQNPICLHVLVKYIIMFFNIVIFLRDCRDFF